MRILASGIFAVVLSALPIKKANADEYLNFVQVTCEPEMHYFSIRSFSAYDLPSSYYSFDAALQKIENINGIYLLSRLHERADPLTCSIPTKNGSQLITAKMNYYHEPQDHGMCGGAEYGSLVVSTDGASEEMAAGYSCEQKVGIKSEIIVNFGVNLLNHCRTLGGDDIPVKENFADIKTECRSIHLKN